MNPAIGMCAPVAGFFCDGWRNKRDFVYVYLFAYGILTMVFPMDLFTPIVQSDQLHPEFVNILAFRNEANINIVNGWGDGFVDRDGKFIREFQTTFHSSFWELYLYAVLKNVGCTVDFKYASPDFVVTGPIGFSIEAAVALHAQGTPSATDFGVDYIPNDLNEFNRNAIIRLANTVSSKHRKFGSSQNIVGKGFCCSVMIR
jgi:hypothetical protein